MVPSFYKKDYYMKDKKKYRLIERVKKMAERTDMKRGEDRQGSGSTLFLLPSLIGVLVFFFIPFLIVIYYALIDNPISHHFVGISNFIMIMKNNAFKKAAFNTGMFSLVAVPLAVLLSLGLALLLDRKMPLRSNISSFFLSPLMVPTASVVLIWQVLFHNDGTVNQILQHFGAKGVDWLYSKQAMVVVTLLFLWKNLGYNMVLFISALASVPKSLLEAAVLENASSFQVFWHIKLRYMTSTIFFVVLMSLINSFKVFREVYLLKGDYPYETMYTLQHFMNNTFRSMDYQKMSAAAIMMALIMAVVIGILFKIESVLGKDVEDE